MASLESLRQRLFVEFPCEPPPRWRDQPESQDEIGCRGILLGKRWNDVSSYEAKRAYDCMFSTSADVGRYYLPAYLSALLDAWPSNLDSALLVHVENWLTYVKPDAILPPRLSRGQRRCVHDFLVLLAETETLNREETPESAEYRRIAEAWASDEWDRSKLSYERTE